MSWIRLSRIVNSYLELAEGRAKKIPRRWKIGYTTRQTSSN